jgi:hypothetical protein
MPSSLTADVFFSGQYLARYIRNCVVTWKVESAGVDIGSSLLCTIANVQLWRRLSHSVSCTLSSCPASRRRRDGGNQYLQTNPRIERRVPLQTVNKGTRHIIGRPNFCFKTCIPGTSFCQVFIIGKRCGFETSGHAFFAYMAWCLTVSVDILAVITYTELSH